MPTAPRASPSRCARGVHFYPGVAQPAAEPVRPARHLAGRLAVGHAGLARAPRSPAASRPPHVYLVMTSAGRHPAVRVLLDGRPIPPATAGADVRGGLVTVRGQRLYTLVSLPDGRPARADRPDPARRQRLRLHVRLSRPAIEQRRGARRRSAGVLTFIRARRRATSISRAPSARRRALAGSGRPATAPSADPHPAPTAAPPAHRLPAPQQRLDAAAAGGQQRRRALGGPRGQPATALRGHERQVDRADEHRRARRRRSSAWISPDQRMTRLRRLDPQRRSSPGKRPAGSRVSSAWPTTTTVGHRLAASAARIAASGWSQRPPGQRHRRLGAAEPAAASAGQDDPHGRASRRASARDAGRHRAAWSSAPGPAS